MAHTQKKNKKVADTLISKSVSFVGSFFLLLLFTVFLCVLFSAFFFFIPYLRCFFFSFCTSTITKNKRVLFLYLHCFIISYFFFYSLAFIHKLL